jgi:hypothetical protein|tara:strand:- start:58 stop:258 length:201 start_codon:yes stop_codon:yes gene_type:complete
MDSAAELPGASSASYNSQQRQQKTQQNKFWLQNHVNHVLEPMILETCKANPDDKVSYYLLDWPTNI